MPNDQMTIEDSRHTLSSTVAFPTTDVINLKNSCDAPNFKLKVGIVARNASSELALP